MRKQERKLPKQEEMQHTQNGDLKRLTKKREEESLQWAEKPRIKKEVFKLLTKKQDDGLQPWAAEPRMQNEGYKPLTRRPGKELPVLEEKQRRREEKKEKQHNPVRSTFPLCSHLLRSCWASMDIHLNTQAKKEVVSPLSLNYAARARAAFCAGPSLIP